MLPPAPHSYTTQPSFDTMKPIQQFAVYLAAIGALYDFALRSWYGFLRSASFKVLVGDLSLDLHVFDASAGQNNYIIRAIVELLTDMREHKPGFFHATSSIMSSRVLVAILEIGEHKSTEEKAPISATKANISIGHLLSTKTGIPMVLTGDNPAFPEGWHIVDDPKLVGKGFAILWRKQGDDRRFSLEEVFMMFVEGLVLAAQHPNYNRVAAAVDAVSPDWDVGFHMQAVDNFDLRWFQVVMTLYSLPTSVIVATNTLTEIEFQLWKHMTKAAEGNIWKIFDDVRRLGSGNSTATS